MKRKLFVYKSPIGDIYCLFDGAELIELSMNEIIGNRQIVMLNSECEMKNEDFLNSAICNPQSAMSYSLSPIALRLFKELDAYFNSDLKEFNQKIKFVSGTDFEHKVWLTLKEIPYGETRSYKWISEKVGRPKAMRAVGQALKKNPMPIILPCHRVIASDGSIGGFSCGVEIKRWLLRHERALKHV